MIKLTPTQLTILAAAHGREDGGLTRPASVRPAAAETVAAKLIEGKLVREVRAKGDLPVWRQDEAGRTFSLIILKAGRAAVAEQSRDDWASAGTDESAPYALVPDVGLMTGGSRQGSAATPRRQGSKRGLIISMLQQPNGASTADLMAATGWLPHTTRAATTGLRKAGLAVERSRDADTHGSVYRLAPAIVEAE